MTSEVGKDGFGLHIFLPSSRDLDSSRCGASRHVWRLTGKELFCELVQHDQLPQADVRIRRDVTQLLLQRLCDAPAAAVGSPTDWRWGEECAVASPRRDDQGAARFGSRLAIGVRHRRVEVDRIASLEQMLLVTDLDMQRP